MSEFKPKNLMSTMDGNEWAEEFMKLWSHRFDQVDHDLMRTWFCSAIMCGFDHANQKTPERWADERIEIYFEEQENET